LIRPGGTARYEDRRLQRSCLAVPVAALIGFHAPLFSPLAHHKAAVDRDRLTGDLACGRTTQEENGIGLLRPALHGNERVKHGLQPLTLGLHLVAHRRADHAGTDVVHADAARRILKSSALREADDPMLRGVVRSALRTTDSCRSLTTI
jgi:hypothetical protein